MYVSYSFKQKALRCCILYFIFIDFIYICRLQDKIWKIFFIDREQKTYQQTNPFREHCLDWKLPSPVHCGTYPLPSFSLTTNNSANNFCCVHIVTLFGNVQCLPHSPPSQHFCIEGHSRSWAQGVPQSSSEVEGTGQVPAFCSSKDAGQQTP